MRDPDYDGAEAFDDMKAHAKTQGEWRGGMSATKEVEATPRPWKVYRDPVDYSTLIMDDTSNLIVARVAARGDKLTDANAALIVRAVNAHDEAIKSMEFALEALDSGEPEIHEEAAGYLEAALTKAKGDSHA